MSVSGRSRLPANKRNYQIQRLQDSHQEILRQSVLGRTREDIAIALGISPATVTNVRNSELGRAQTEVLHSTRDEATTDIAQKIQELLPTAVGVLEDVMSGNIEMPKASNVTVGQRIKVAQDLVGRGGHVAPSRVEAKHEHEHKFSAEDIQGIKDRARLSQKNNIIEAEIVEPAQLKDESNAEDTNT